MFRAYDGAMADDPDLAALSAAIGDPARAAMLAELLGGQELPAGALARIARVSPSTASAHLAKLRGVGLTAVQRRGRHRYYRLANAEVAHAIEALVALAPARSVTSLGAANRLQAERAARSCYDHAAGALGVAIAERLGDAGALDLEGLALTDPEQFRALGVEPDEIRPGRRPLVLSCLDWSERRPHLAGALGASLLRALIVRRWVVRRGGRALVVTASGREGLRRSLDLDVLTLSPRSAEREP